MNAKPRRPPKERPPDPHAAGAPWRLFIAIPMPEPVRALIGEIVADLGGDDAPVRWTAAGQSHLTLHFLGETDPAQAELLRLSFPSFANRRAAFEIETGALGCFPESSPPNVVWLGLSRGGHELTALHRDIGQALARLSFEPEERAFRPHITLGRVRDGVDRPTAERLRTRVLDPARRARLLAETATIPVREVHLIRSYLEKSGARHETIAVAKLLPSG